MSDRKLRWGLLSTARINRSVIPPLRMSPRNELVAVASRSKDKAEAYAKQWDIPRTFGSYEEMLADPGIDVIYNPLPNSLHAHWTIEAARAGKHVLCEKPLAISAAEVDAMVEAAKQAGVVVTEAFMYRHHPQTLKVKELVDGGAIGRLRMVRGSFSFNLSREGDVRLDPALGGGSIWDVGCYPISYARFIIGAEPIEVFGRQVLGQTGVDELFTGSLVFPTTCMPSSTAASARRSARRSKWSAARGRSPSPARSSPDRRNTSSSTGATRSSRLPCRVRSCTWAKSRTWPTPSWKASRRASAWPTAGRTWRRSSRCCVRPSRDSPSRWHSWQQTAVSGVIPKRAHRACERSGVIGARGIPVTKHSSSRCRHM